MRYNYYELLESKLESTAFHAGSIYFTTDSGKLFFDPAGGGVRKLIGGDFEKHGVSITNIVESIEGTTICFSDGNIVTIKNGNNGKSAYEYAKESGYTGTEADFEKKMARDIPAVTQEMGESESLVMSQIAVTNALKAITALPYGGSKEWLENNGDKEKLYQIDGYVWGYIESDGWTKSGTRYLVVSNESDMINEGGTEYLLRQGDEGTVYLYTEASGDIDIPVYDSFPETANAGDIIAIDDRKYRASISEKEVPAYTNCAEPNASNTTDWSIWCNNARIGSDGTYRQSDSQVVSNYIQVSKEDIIRWDNMNLSNCAIGIYDSNKNFIASYILPDLQSKGHVTDASDVSLITYDGHCTIANENISFIRFTMILKNTVDDVIITVNEEIATKIEKEITWGDIGEYIIPIEAGWKATDITYNVIDSLSNTANNFTTAVYSEDGYVYSYISGASWVSISKYTYQGLLIDNKMSDTSANAVQNKIITKELNNIKGSVNHNTDNIISLQNKVESLDDVSSSEMTIPSYWENSVNERTNTIKDLQSAGGKNCISFAWASDTHIPDNDNGRTTDLGKIMAKMLDNCEIPFALLTGDINTRASFKEEASLVDAQNEMKIHLAPLWGTDRLLIALGNHDGCYGDSSGYYRKQFKPERMWNIFFRGQALDFRRVFSDDGLYFYIDNVVQKTRFIILNSQFGGEYSENDNGWAVNNRFSTSCYGQAQLDWLSDIALNMPNGYSAIITSHVPPNIDYTVDKSQLIGIIDAYNNRTTFSGSYTNGVNGWSNSTVNVDFTNAEGEIIAMFAGHVHWDKVDTTTMSCPIITIMAAGASVNEYQMEEGEVAPTRTSGTATETSFDIVTINKSTRTIYCTRIGAGSDREINY